MEDMVCSVYAADVSVDGTIVNEIIHYNWSKDQEPAYHAYQPGRFL
jgi:hypothetical protein